MSVRLTDQPLRALLDLLSPGRRAPWSSSSDEGEEREQAVRRSGGAGTATSSRRRAERGEERRPCLLRVALPAGPRLAQDLGAAQQLSSSDEEEDEEALWRAKLRSLRKVRRASQGTPAPRRESAVAGSRSAVVQGTPAEVSPRGRSVTNMPELTCQRVAAEFAAWAASREA